MTKVKHYFLDGNTSKGYVTLVDQVVSAIDHIYVIKGKLGAEKTEIFQSIGKAYEQQGLAVHFLHNPSNEEFLDGVIIPENRLAVLDGSGRTGIEAKYSQFVERVFDLDEALDKVKLVINKNTIITMNTEIEQLHEKAYAKFAKGKEIHEKKEELYIAAMDFEKANKVIAQLAATLFHAVTVPKTSLLVNHLFFGAATPNGAINYIDNITSDIDKRYIIKGRSGSGKSTLMRKIGAYAENVGLSVQYFPCGLDPNSLDMIYIPALSVAILDGTAPHVIEPTRATDEVIDMFELCMDQSVDSKYQEEFDQLHSAYKQEMKEGTAFLKKAKNIKVELDQFYREAVNQEKLDTIVHDITSATIK